MTQEELRNNRERFEKLLSQVKRDGIDRLLNYLRNSDFYTAPASTKYHLSCEGGLLQHSLNVYDCLESKKEDPTWKEIIEAEGEESVIVMSLLHDICKTQFYVKGTKNQKTYDAAKVAAAERWQIKHDDKGDFIWETVDAYTIEDEMPLGHGEKSVYIINGYMRLTREEAFAIRYHMGFSGTEDNRDVGKAFEMFPLAYALHAADSEATYFLEGKE